MAIDAYMVFNPTKSKSQTGESIEVRGESSDQESKERGSFEILSFEWGASAGKETSTKKTQTGTGTTAPGGLVTTPPPNVMGAANEKHRVVTVDNFRVAKPFDTASPGLFMACTDPKCVFAEAVIVFRKSSGTEPFVYLKFVFKDVRIDSVEWKIEAAEGTDKPDQEDLKCSFQECEIFYSPQAATGEKAMKWSGAGTTGSASKRTASYKRDKALPKKN